LYLRMGAIKTTTEAIGARRPQRSIQRGTGAIMLGMVDIIAATRDEFQVVAQ
jgi:hypothetical protein